MVGGVYMKIYDMLREVIRQKGIIEGWLKYNAHALTQEEKKEMEEELKTINNIEVNLLKWSELKCSEIE